MIKIQLVVFVRLLDVGQMASRVGVSSVHHKEAAQIIEDTFVV